MKLKAREKYHLSIQRNAIRVEYYIQDLKKYKYKYYIALLKFECNNNNVFFT